MNTDFADTIGAATVHAAVTRRKQDLAMGPDAIARAMALAIERPANVEIAIIVVHPTAQD